MELFLRNTPSVVNIANIGTLMRRPLHCPACMHTMEALCFLTVGPGIFMERRVYPKCGNMVIHPLPYASCATVSAWETLLESNAFTLHSAIGHLRTISGFSKSQSGFDQWTARGADRGCRSAASRTDFYTMDTMQVPQGTGSGFIWDMKGHVVTNFHVIRGASDIKVALIDSSVYPAKVCLHVVTSSAPLTSAILARPHISLICCLRA